MSFSMVFIDSESNEVLTSEVCFLTGFEERHNVFQPNATDNHDPIQNQHIYPSDVTQNLQTTKQKYPRNRNLL